LRGKLIVHLFKKKESRFSGDPFEIISYYFTNKVPSGFPKIKVKEEVNFI
jgi:hypothetical protein